MTVWRPFIVPLRQHWRWWLLGAGLGLLTVLASVGLLALSGWFITATALAGPALAVGFDVFRPAAMIRLFAILRTAGRYGERVVSHEATFRLLATLRVWVFQRLEPLAPAGLGHYRSGELLNRVVADVDALDNLYLRILSPVVIALVSVTVVTMLMARYSVPVALVSAVVLLVAGIAVPLLVQRLGRGPGSELGLVMGRLRERWVSLNQGLAELVIYGAVDRELGILDADQEVLIAEQRRMALIEGLGNGLLVMLAGLGVWAALYLGALAVSDGELAAGFWVLMVLVILAAFEAVQPLPLAFQYLSRTQGAAGRLHALTTQTPKVIFPTVSRALPTDSGVEFKGVTFRYHPTAEPVLNNLSLQIRSGSRIAVIGATGAGKSTLVQLLVRFWDPDQGSVCLGGVDLRWLSEGELRRRVALVSQRPHLFSGSLRDNLLLAAPDATEEALHQALTDAQLHDLLQQLPNGLDTWIGEAGLLLSGGQARRLVIARALLQDASLLILDEPTEGLDNVTAREVLLALERLMVGRTVCLITHRLQDLRGMDRVAVLDQGQVVEWDRPAVLLARSSRLQALCAQLAD